MKRNLKLVLILIFILLSNSLSYATPVDLIEENFGGNVSYIKSDNSMVDLSWSDSVTFDNGKIHLGINIPSGDWGFLNIFPLHNESFSANDDFRISVSFENFSYGLAGINDSAQAHQVHYHGDQSGGVLNGFMLDGNDNYNAWEWPSGIWSTYPAGGVNNGTFVYEKIGATARLSFENVPGAEWVFDIAGLNQQIHSSFIVHAYSGGETSVDITNWDVEILTAPVPEPSTITLFGIGLLGLAGMGRKKFKNHSLPKNASSVIL